MRPVLCGVVLISWLTFVQAQSRFDGTWKIDLAESQSSTTLYVYLLQDNTYRCTTCDPPLDIRADGRDRKITGEPCFDTVRLKVVDDWTTVETDKRNGKTVGTSKMTVSSDGNSATVDWTESCNVNGDVDSETFILSRVTKGPRGSHAVSGSWQILKRVSLSENALVVTLKLEGDTFSFADPTGQSYSARLDGTETPFKGDLSNTMVSVKRIGENTIEEIDKHDGKVVEVTRFTPSADGETMTVSMENKVKETTRQFVLHKQ
ncbi:MAG TPA: hypothetical protein VKI40_04835 [Terriglobales bacterium]|nr:hypothetical protein [Terriglobales bacterium]